MCAWWCVHVARYLAHALKCCLIEVTGPHGHICFVPNCKHLLHPQSDCACDLALGGAQWYVSLEPMRDLIFVVDNLLKLPSSSGSIRKFRNALDGWGGVAAPRYFCVTLLPKPLVFALRDGWGWGQKFAFLALRNLRTLPREHLQIT